MYVIVLFGVFTPLGKPTELTAQYLTLNLSLPTNIKPIV